MSRPWVVVSLLLFIALTSQLEWKQQLPVGGQMVISIPELGLSHHSKREQAVKEKIILSQEKSIQKLNELVQSLREQLLQCKTEKYVDKSITNSLAEHVNELEDQPFLED